MASYVIHRARGAPSRERASGQIAERQLVDDFRHRARDLVPELRQVVAFGAPASPALRLERGAGALHGAEDVAHGEVLGRTREMVTAGGSALGREEARALQGEQHLLEVRSEERRVGKEGRAVE